MTLTRDERRGTAGEGIPTGPLFARPTLHRALLDRVIPFLRTYPFANVWCAGCWTGQQAYATAILLSESGLGERVRVYATDASAGALWLAREGVYAGDALSEADYRAAGGREHLGAHLSLHGDRAAVRAAIRRQVTFAQHDLGTDASFNEFQLILCQPVLDAMTVDSRRRVARLLHDSLCPLGVVAVGDSSAASLAPPLGSYERLDPREGLYRRTA